MRNIKNGFTLVEMLVALVVLAFVAGGVWFSFSSYAARTELESARARVAGLVAHAREKTLAGEGGAAWGVHFDEDKAVLFKAPTYSPTGGDNKTETMPRRVVISSTSFSNNEVIFARLTGAANVGTTTLSVRGNSSISATVSVSALGVVE